MDRFAVMVDAGYFLRQSIEIVSNRASTSRGDLEITDPAAMVKALIDKSRTALSIPERELLRVYWYDGVMSRGSTSQQRSIMELPDVNFRAGTVNSAGQQKGVDPLIVTDLIELAANHAICDASLMTGDGDLVVGIDLAQKKGVRIAVLGLEDLSAGVSHKQSFEVTSRADRIARFGGAELSAFMRYTPAKPTSTVAAPPTSATAAAAASGTASTQPTVTTLPPLTPEETTAIETAVKQFVQSQASMAGAVDVSTKRIDPAVDRALIHHVYEAFGHHRLSNLQKNFARQSLRNELGNP